MTIIHFLLICFVFWLIFGILGLLQRRSLETRCKVRDDEYKPISNEKLAQALKEDGYKLNIYKGDAG